MQTDIYYIHKLFKCISEVMEMAYSNLKAEMGRRDITIEAISKLLGIHRNSAANKLNGPSSFSIEEAIKIKSEFFPDYEYKYLFKHEEEKEAV